MFKNKKFEVKMLDDKKTDEEGLSPRPPMDRLDIEMLTHEITTDIVAAYFAIKGFKTLCSIAEHVVVTKVK